jgi:hypothetical protein
MTAYKIVNRFSPDSRLQPVPDHEVVWGDVATFFEKCESLDEAERRLHAWKNLQTRLHYLTQRRGHMVCQDDCDCGFREEWLAVEQRLTDLERGRVTLG